MFQERCLKKTSVKDPEKEASEEYAWARNAHAHMSTASQQLSPPLRPPLETAAHCLLRKSGVERTLLAVPGKAFGIARGWPENHT